MRLLPALSVLLLALQLVGAVHSDQPQRSGFVKVKRAVAGQREASYQERLELERRGEESEISKYTSSSFLDSLFPDGS